MEEFRTDTSLVKEKELAMAKMLISSLEAEFEPQKYHDTYRDNLQKMIEAKIEGQKVVATPSAHIAPVIDIMEALKKSLAEKKKPAMAETAMAAHASVEAQAEAEAEVRAEKARYEEQGGLRLSRRSVSAFSAPSGVSSCLNIRYRSRPAASKSFDARREGVDVVLRVLRLAQPVINKIGGDHLRHFQPLRFRHAKRNIARAKRVVDLLGQPDAWRNSKAYRRSSGSSAR